MEVVDRLEEVETMALLLEVLHRPCQGSEAGDLRHHERLG